AGSQRKSGRFHFCSVIAYLTRLGKIRKSCLSRWRGITRLPSIAELHAVLLGERHPKPLRSLPGNHQSRAPASSARNRRLPGSRTRHVSRPVVNAPVSILIRVGRTSGSAVGEWPCTTILPKLVLLFKNSPRIHSRSLALCCSRGIPGRTPAWHRK